MAQFPALDIWTDAWLADTAHLPRVDRDIYFHLMILMWRTPNCRVPNDMDWIARKLRCTQDELSILDAVASEFCDSDGNWLTQKRLTKEYKKALERSKQQSDRAKSRWNKDKDSSRGNAAPHINGNAPTATTTITLKKGKNSIEKGAGIIPIFINTPEWESLKKEKGGRLASYALRDPDTKQYLGEGTWKTKQ